jgi:hypothetical protein
VVGGMRLRTKPGGGLWDGVERDGKRLSSEERVGSADGGLVRELDSWRSGSAFPGRLTRGELVTSIRVLGRETWWDRRGEKHKRANKTQNQRERNWQDKR